MRLFLSVMVLMLGACSSPRSDSQKSNTVVESSDDGTFDRERLYLGKSSTPLSDSGQFAWNEAGGVVTLAAADGTLQMYQVGENQLFHLDRGGNRITGDLAARYVLRQSIREPRRASGNGSCNNFFGGYVIHAGQRIHFAGNMGATMMACPDMSTEQSFMEALRKVDNYTVSGDELSLNKARMAPLLRFRLATETE